MDKEPVFDVLTEPSPNLKSTFPERPRFVCWISYLNSSIRPSPSVVVTLRPVGAAPILTNLTFKLSSDKRMYTVIHNIRKLLKGVVPEEDAIYVFVNSFCPSPDESVYDLYKAFGDNGKLVVNYALTQAWG